MPPRAHEITAQMFWSLLPPHVGKEAGEHAQGGVNVSVHVAAHARSVEALLEPTVQSTRGGPSHVVVLVHDASQEAAARAVALPRAAPARCPRGGSAMPSRPAGCSPSAYPGEGTTAASGTAAPGAGAGSASPSPSLSLGGAQSASPGTPSASPSPQQHVHCAGCAPHKEPAPAARPWLTAQASATASPTLSLSTLPSPVPSPRAPVSASGRRSHTPPLPRRPPAPHPLPRQQHGQHRTSPSAAHAHAAEKREVAAVPSCRGLGRAAAGCSLGPRQGEARRAEVS